MSLLLLFGEGGAPAPDAGVQGAPAKRSRTGITVGMGGVNEAVAGLAMFVISVALISM